MSNTDDTGALTRGLRDFFAAANGTDLAQAYARIAAHCEAPPPPDNWDETEFAFNRLFVGPGPLAAPPFSSVYLDPEPKLMGRSTSLVRAVHQALGLQSAWFGSVPDDHLAVELDTALALNALAAKALANAELAELRRYFMVGHMGRWVPLFADRVLAQHPQPGPIVTAIRRLELWLAEQIAALPPERSGPKKAKTAQSFSNLQLATGGNNA